MHDSFHQFDASLKIFFAVSLILGLVNVFAGYTFWRWLLGALGFVSGFGGAVMASALAGNQEQAATIGFVTGVALALIFAGIKPIGAFFFGGFTAVSLSALLFELTKISGQLDLSSAGFIAIIIFLFGGITMIACNRVGIIVATSIAGALTAVNAVSVLLAKGDTIRAMLTAHSPNELVAMIVIFGIGMLVQFSTTSGDSPLTSNSDSLPSNPTSDLQREQKLANLDSAEPPPGLISDRRRQQLLDSLTSAPCPPGPTSESEILVERKLNELRRLLEKGLISQQEYDAKKGELLKRL